MELAAKSRSDRLRIQDLLPCLSDERRVAPMRDAAAGPRLALRCTRAAALAEREHRNEERILRVWCEVVLSSIDLLQDLIQATGSLVARSCPHERTKSETARGKRQQAWRNGSPMIRSLSPWPSMARLFVSAQSEP